MEIGVSIEVKHWEELSKDDLYSLLQLRTAVFVVEQDCPYQECDGVDKVAFHVLICEDDSLIGTSRIIPKSDDLISLGRIVVKKEKRVEGFGKLLMKTSLDYTISNLKPQKITMSAQTYLISFYSSFGFQTRGEEYLEDNIPHIRMELEIEAN